MTEAEWLASENPLVMLTFLTRDDGLPETYRPLAANRARRDRKMRLFCAALLRHEEGYGYRAVDPVEPAQLELWVETGVCRYSWLSSWQAVWPAELAWHLCRPSDNSYRVPAAVAAAKAAQPAWAQA